MMNKGILLAATLLVTSAPALAQAPLGHGPVGGVDGTLGNGNVESQAPWINEPVTTSSIRPRARRQGGVYVESQAPWRQDPMSTSSTQPGWRQGGGVDGTYGNGNVPSQAPWIR
jgi:hypothetical protein